MLVNRFEVKKLKREVGMGQVKIRQTPCLRLLFSDWSREESAKDIVFAVQYGEGGRMFIAIALRYVVLKGSDFHIFIKVGACSNAIFSHHGQCVRINLHYFAKRNIGA